eukprot:4560398-Pyramimonas_sp.AAC.1
MVSNSWLLRARNLRHRLTKWQRGRLSVFLAGGDHTQHILQRSSISVDTSAVCRLCDREQETQEHILWECPCWREERAPLLQHPQ